MKILLGLIAALILTGCSQDGSIAKAERGAKPPAAVEDDISIYFSPRGGAMAAIIDEMNHAQRSIDVQAYLITAQAVVEALKAAHERGVQVRVILDRNNPGGIYSAAAYLSNPPFPLWRDGRHKDAHDKIMLIDNQTIITGSFNFTDQSEDQNAENLLIIRNKPRLFAAYLANFEKHLSHSEQTK